MTWKSTSWTRSWRLACYRSQVKDSGRLLEMYMSTLFSSEEAPQPASQQGAEAHGNSLDCREPLDPPLVLGPRLPQRV